MQNCFTLGVNEKTWLKMVLKAVIYPHTPLPHTLSASPHRVRNKDQLLRPALAPWSKEGSAEAVGPVTFPLVSGTEGGGPDKLAIDAKGRRPAVIKPRVVQR